MKNVNTVRHLRSVSVIFNGKGEILFGQRFEPGHNWHLFWNIPGGGIEFGEHPKDTAIRETKEEVGVTVELLDDHPSIHNFIHQDNGDEVIIISYPSVYKSGDINVTGDKETSDARWFKFEDIDFTKCPPLTKEVIQDAIARFPKQFKNS